MSDKQKCAERIFRGFHSYLCLKPATISEDGKWWCGTHAPSNVEIRRKKQDDKWRAQQAAANKRHAVESAGQRIVSAALAWNGKDDPTELRQAINHYHNVKAS